MVSLSVKGIRPFTRPEMKVERVMTLSPLQLPELSSGLLKPAIRWVIDRNTALNPIQFTNVRATRSERFRSRQQVADAGSSQNDFFWTCCLPPTTGCHGLAGRRLCHQAHFEMVLKKAVRAIRLKSTTTLPSAIAKGQHHAQPCLGTREFAANVSILRTSLCL